MKALQRARSVKEYWDWIEHVDETRRKGSDLGEED